MIVMALWIISSKNVKTRVSKVPKIPRFLGVRGYFLGNSLWGILDFSGVLGAPRV